MGFKVELEADELEDFLRAVSLFGGRRGRKRLLRAWGLYMVRETRRNIQAGGTHRYSRGVRFEPNSPRWAAAKRGNPKMGVLKFTGSLVRSITWNVKRLGRRVVLEVGSPLPYSKKVLEGTSESQTWTATVINGKLQKIDTRSNRTFTVSGIPRRQYLGVWAENEQKLIEIAQQVLRKIGRSSNEQGGFE